MRSIIVATIFVLTFSLSAFSQEQSEDPMMKAMMEYATPGDPHKSLSVLAGSWDVNMTSYFDPSGKPTEQKASSTFEPILDGRYLVEKVEGDFMGQPFHGIATFGYDNGTKQYVSTWVDNFGTGIMTGTGTSTDGGKTINWVSKGYDPMTRKVQEYRSSIHIKSNDEMHFEMYGPGPDGKEMKMMESTYTRKK